MLERILKRIDFVSENTGKLFAWSLVVIMAIVLLDVTMRRLFANPSAWAFEVTYMLWGAYLVMIPAWTHLLKNHIAIDTFSNRLSPRVRLILNLVLYAVLCLSWVGAVVKGGIDFAKVSWQIHEHTLTPWGPPIYPLKTILPIGFIILWFQCLAHWIRDLRTFIGR